MMAEDAGGGGYVDAGEGEYVVAEGENYESGEGEEVAGLCASLRLSTGIRRYRMHKNELPAALVAGHERRGDAAGVTVEPFGAGRVFSHSVAFLRACAQYEEKTHTRFTSRDSVRVTTANKKWIAACAAKGIAEDSAECKAGILSETLGHQKIVRRCKYGVFYQPRGTGERDAQTSQYLKCDARYTAEVVKIENGESVFVTRDEYHHHNHDCDQDMLDSNGKSALLARPEVLAEVSRLIQAKAPSRNICDSLATNFNIVITCKELANIKRDRLGGLSAMANLKLLLARFASFSQSHCALIDDQEGQVCGVIIQSASQKKMFQRYGDNLILDWTHNTNNHGFFLGSLMATSATGRGVSVFDFLCLEQTESMMTTVFESFVANNPGAREKIKSFVIDKDYKEWRVLQRVFPGAVVLLCQFHVVKWFAYVITMRKYNLDVALRERVLKILLAMVYARTVFDFEMHQDEMQELLEDSSPAFLVYLSARWYDCRAMWSDCERTLVFTALNTTSNRIESSWNQIKKMLGKMLRVDLCLEAIFAYMTAVLRREYRVINKYSKRIVLRSKANEFIRSASAELSEFTSDKVMEQWRLFSAHDIETGDPYKCVHTQGNTERYQLRRLAPDSKTYNVDCEQWSCSCEFNITSALPCRHLIYVSKNVLRHREYPVDTIPSRWRMASAYDLLPLLKANARDIQTLRTGLLLSDATFSMLVQKDYGDAITYVEPDPRRVSYLRLHRAEVEKIVVLNNLEKRNVVESQFSAVTKFLVQQSTPVFLGLAREMEFLLESKLAQWLARENKKRSTGPSAEGVESEQDPTFEDTVDDEALIASAIAEEEARFNDADPFPGLDVQAISHDPSHVQESHESHQVVPVRVDLDSSIDSLLFSDDEAASVLDDLSLTNSLRFDPRMVDSADPFVCEVMDVVAERHVQQTAIPDLNDGRSVSSSSATNLSTNAISELINGVVSSQHDPASARSIPKPQSSIATMSSGDISAFMTSVVRTQLRTEQEPPLPMHGLDRVRLGPTSKRKATGKTPSVNTLKELVNSEDHSDQVQLLTLPPRLGRGNVKKQKTTKTTGRRLTYVEESSTFPITLQQFTTAMEHTVCSNDIENKMQMLPTLLTEQHLLKLKPQVYTGTSSRVLNYSVPKELTDLMNVELEAKRKRDHFVQSALNRGVSRETGVTCVDLSVEESPKDGLVVSISSSLKGFSEHNILHLKAFHRLSSSFVYYGRDVFWLRKTVMFDHTHPRIPYLEVKLREQLSAQQDPVKTVEYANEINYGAGLLATHVLQTCTPATTFHIDTTAPHLQSSIATRDIVGYLCRDAKLNDAIMTYSLRQMATDHDDVHVFDCHFAASGIPSSNLTAYRWVFFPINISNQHWCLASVKVSGSQVQKVVLYDPMQGPFEPELQRIWKEKASPVFSLWARRDLRHSPLAHTEAPVVEFLRIAEQKDGVSCGVFCVALAWELMSESTFFQGLGRVSAESIYQLRLRMLWRIVCLSVRQDHPEDENEASRTLAGVENTTTAPAKASKRKTEKKK